MDKKKLRSGFTTGTCAAAAAKGAALLLVTGRRPETVRLTTPKGTAAVLPLLDMVLDETGASCGIRKDAGDDPDVTDQTMVYAHIGYLDGRQPGESWYGSEEYPGLWLAGGAGIGMVTKNGLSCPVGKPAINPVPRRMIFEAAARVLEEYGAVKPAVVTVSIPDGVRLAEKTFNPKLGITGGLSVLGTSGIVEPMSEAALLATIRLELHMKAVAGKRTAVLAPGNYGLNFLAEELGIRPESVVKCSNFIEDSMKMAAEEGFQGVLLAGHAGKLIKAAGGAGNTHSAHGDNRMETMAGLVRQVLEEEGSSGSGAASGLARRVLEEEGSSGSGAASGLARRVLEKDRRSGMQLGPGKRSADRAENDCRALEQQVLQANTTEEAIELLRRAGLDVRVMTLAADRLKDRLEQWSGRRLTAETVIFSSVYGILGTTAGAGKLAAVARDER